MRIGAIEILPVFDGVGREQAAEVLTRPGVSDAWACHADQVDEHGVLRLDLGGFLVRTGERVVLVDAGVGTIDNGQYAGGRFLQSLRGHGVAREDVTDVVFTHLHFDHVGWNTRLVDGAWVPTFPNARYLIPRAEWEFWRTGRESIGSSDLSDTLGPVLDAGLVDFVEPGHEVAHGVHLEAAPGHTPGQVAVVVSSEGERAVVTGDLVHHPVQFAAPEIPSAADEDAALATATRRAFVDRYADTGTLVVGTHFPSPTAGWLTRRGTGAQGEGEREVRFVVERG